MPCLSRLRALSTLPLFRHCLLALLLAAGLIVCFHPGLRFTHAAALPQSNTPVTTVSAASYAPVVAPDSIVAAFGVGLATEIKEATTVPLPTTLAGTTVRVNGEAAPLFFVAPNQINYLIPSGTPSGLATVSVTASDGRVSSGTVQIAQAAPALFAANSSGSGPLAANLLRVKANGQRIFELLAIYDGTKFITKPFDFGDASDQLFLVLYLTGVRQASIKDVRVIIGGVEYAPLFVGPVEGLVGLDQINVALPRSFSGRGKIQILIKAAGAAGSNSGEFEIGSGSVIGNAQLMITGVNTNNLKVGDEFIIKGTGFTANLPKEQVQIVADDGVTTNAEVLGVSSDSLRARVPFGAGTGSVRVVQGTSEASTPVSVRSSISGFVENTSRQPLANVTVRLLGGPVPITAKSNADGSFVLSDVPPSQVALIEFDGSTTQASPPYPKVTLKLLGVKAGRDIQFKQPIAIQQGTTQAPPGANSVLTAASTPRDDLSIQDGNLVFDLPPGAVVQCPDGTSTCALALAQLTSSRTPENLPRTHFSSVIAQLTPFGAKFTPGGKLTFPNTDNIPAGTQATLFKFDQTINSATLGTFIVIGTATVSADGQRVETAANAITEGSYYFVSIERPLAAINGRVVESDGRPVPRAIVRARGQSTFTDGFGGFVLRDVPVLKASGDKVKVEVSYQRPNGFVSRKDSTEVMIFAGQLSTVTPDIVLDPVITNAPPVILAPQSLTLMAGETRDFDFIAIDPDNSQSVQLTASGTATSFTTLGSQGQGVYRLHLTPAANAGGSYTLTLTAKDVAADSASQSIAVTVTPNDTSKPVARSQSVTTPEDTAKAIALTGADPGGKALSFAIVTPPLRGSLSGTSQNPTYTPAKDYNGTDSFTFKVSNGSAESSVATVFMAISPVNDAPVLNVPGAQSVNAGETLNLIVSASDVDGDQTLLITPTGLPQGATFETTGGVSRQLSWTPTFAQSGVYTISFRVSDNGSPVLSETKSLMITVIAGWAKTSGPEGRDILSLISFSGVLYTGTQSGIYRSGNNGQTWSAASNGLPGNAQDVRAFAAGSNLLFAGTSLGVYRSGDGQNWLPGNGLEDRALDVRALQMLGSNLFAGTAGGGVWQSGDNGQNWVVASNGLAGAALDVRALQAVNNTLFAGTSGGGVWQSGNNGQNWTRVSNGLAGAALSVYTLQAVGSNLFAGTQSGIYLSRDNGQNWTRVSNGLASNALDVRALTLSTGSTLLFAGTSGGGVWQSNDNGQKWVSASNGLAGAALDVRALQAVGSNLFAGTNGGVWRSGDNGQNWGRFSDGIAASPIKVFLHTGGRLAASAGQRISTSINNGQSWVAAGSPTSALGVFALQAVGSTLFAGTNSEGGRVADGVYRSGNNGQSWTRASNELSGGALNIFALLAVGNTLFAGTDDGVWQSANSGQSWTRVSNGLSGRVRTLQAVGSSLLFAGTPNGVYQSSNNGQIWTRTGLSGDIRALLQVVNGNLFAGTYGSGVYKSGDNGQTWVAVNNGLSGRALLIHSLYAVDGNLFAGTDGSGPYRSSNNGQSWSAANNGLANERNDALAARSLSAVGSTLFVGTFDGGVYRSGDYGDNWTRVSDGLSGRGLYVFTMMPVAGGRLFAGTLGGIWQTSDSGQNWIAASTGLPGKALYVPALQVAGGRLFAGTRGDEGFDLGHFGEGESVFRLGDDGQSWIPASNGLSSAAVDVRALQAVGNDLFVGTRAGVFRSRDNGQNWTRSNTGLPGNIENPPDVRVLQAVGSNLFAGIVNQLQAPIGYYWSSDQGRNWIPAGSGLPGVLAVHTLQATGSNLLFAGTDVGVYRSDNNGQSWIAVSNGLTGRALNVISLQVVGSSLYAGTLDGLYRSDNNGQTWVRFSSPLPSVEVLLLASDGAHLFAGTSEGSVFVLSNNTQSWAEINNNLPLAGRAANSVAINSANLFSGTLGSGVFSSSSQGQNWISTSSGLPSNANIQSIVTNGATLWAGEFGNGVYRSSDQGAHWTSVSNGLTSRLVNRLFLSGATLYAGTDGGVFCSPDGGNNWTAINTNLTSLRVISITANAGVIYAGTDGGGVFRLNGNGVRWTSVSHGLTSLSVTALGGNGVALYAGTNGGGICLSRDGGENWTPINNQLSPTLNVYAFVVSGKKVYAGSIYGVFVTEDEGQTWKQINAGLLNTFVTGLAVGGNQLFACTASGGVFTSQIP